MVGVKEMTEELVLRAAGPDTVSVCGVICKFTNERLNRPYFACPFYAQDVDFHLPKAVLSEPCYREIVGDAIRRETQLRQNDYCKFPKVPVQWYWVYLPRTRDLHTFAPSHFPTPAAEAYSVNGEYLGYVEESPRRVLWRGLPRSRLP